MTQPSLLDWQPPPQIFGDRDGETFNRARDGKRLNAQMQRVFNSLMLEAMSAGSEGWLTLHDIASETGDPEASISARIRDLRKKKFGGFNVPKEYVARGVWRYRLIA